MDDNDPTLPEGPATPVPDLIEQYRVRRDAWIAQADELARLRDEVRGSAEREAMEIVTAARRNVRQIVMEARRELLVLSAQVQAALGEAAAKQDSSALLNRAGAVDANHRLGSASDELSDATFAPEDAVKSMLDEARADMDALAEDARTVPLQALSLPIPPPPPAPPVPPRVPLEEPVAAHPTFLSPVASRVLLSSQFPSESVPVPAERPLRAFVALFGVAGVAVVLATVWWLRTSDVLSATPETASRPEATPSAPASPPAAPAAAPAAATAATPARATALPVPAPKDTSSDLSLVVEARRESWIRTTVDGEADAGRTFAEGETFRVNAERSVALRVGDAGAVYVSVNKGESLPLGRDGQVVTRQFVVEGAKSAEPAPVLPVPEVAPKPAAAPPRPTVTAPTSAPVATQVPVVQSAAATPNPPALEPGPASAVTRADTLSAPPPRAEPPTPAPSSAPSSPASAVVAASRQWLDAYHRQDRTAMAALSTDSLQLADERRNEEKFPAESAVSRTLDRVSVQIAADTAVLTAVMTERSEDAGSPRVSPISQVWVLAGGQWRVRQVRLVSEARLNQIFR